MLARMFRRLFNNEGAGPKLRDDIVPWNAVPWADIPWDDAPVATPGRAGFAPAGGLPGQVFRAGDDGLSYGWGDAAASSVVGNIDLLPFRVADLAAYAPGWHFCNGDLYPLSGAIGAALAALPENYKTDWGITVSGANISIPNLFHTDGRGFYLRAVNGMTRQAGSVEQDALQRITGYFYPVAGNGANLGFSSYCPVSGAFYLSHYTTSSTFSPSGNQFASYIMQFDSSQVTRSATETRSLNRGATPAIFLGV